MTEAANPAPRATPPWPPTSSWTMPPALPSMVHLSLPNADSVFQQGLAAAATQRSEVHPSPALVMGAAYV